MGEPKPLASLTSGLLARKGGARPAMRRQPLGSGPAPMGGVGAGGYDDLGWNDMGYDVDPAQSAEYAPRVDIKPMLTGSMPVHNIAAEHAADDAQAELTAHPAASTAPIAVPAAKPEVVRQQEALQARVDGAASGDDFGAPQQVPEAAPPVLPAAVLSAKPVRKPSAPRMSQEAPAVAARGKAAFTLRLDAQRHLRLRLASAIYNRSAQQILVDVLDAYLADLPEIDAMASRLPAAPNHRQPTHSLAGDDQ
jgi:hypothetical protein